MEPPRPAVLEDFVSHLDDALKSALGGDADAARVSAERLGGALSRLEGWRDQFGAGNAPDGASAKAVRELQKKAYRLGRIVRHAAWVRQGLREVGNLTVAQGYERDGRLRPSGESRLVVDG